MTEWTRVARADDVPDESALQVKVGETPVCLARSRGQLFAVNDICTHADVSLSEGDVENGRIECWLHGSQFDLATGEPTGLPATIPVATYAVKTEGDDVFVAVKE
ncbi:MAG TPA: non-heme iron oxygenase ferredoxin subunit [Mycobacteriales bacterium]|jgi:3-phenylpropionate/trans-cinnamate dioxygenase ferredoxin subunit|nr:non-heme iron oxygenase ferredoxin subunit [Mycobacteriales bacterium]